MFICRETSFPMCNLSIVIKIHNHFNANLWTNFLKCQLNIFISTCCYFHILWQFKYVLEPSLFSCHTWCRCLGIIATKYLSSLEIIEIGNIIYCHVCYNFHPIPNCCFVVICVNISAQKDMIEPNVFWLNDKTCLY